MPPGGGKGELAIELGVNAGEAADLGDSKLGGVLILEPT
jgi:hypothetical protein